MVTTVTRGRVGWVLVGALLLLIGVRAPLSGGFWLDECLSVWVGSGSVDQVIARAGEYQGQSPLYFLLISPLVHGGVGELGIRTLSLFGFLLSLVFLARIARRWGDGECVLAAVLVFATLDPVLVAAISARPYALALAAALGSVLALLRWCEAGRVSSLIIAGLTAVLAFYLHYLFAGILLVHLAVLRACGKLNLRLLIGGGIALALLCFPGFQQLHHLAGRFEILSFAPTPGPGALGSALVPPYLGVILILALVLARLVDPIRLAARPNPRMVGVVLIWLLGGPLIFFGHAHLTGDSLFLPRLLLWAAPGTALAVALLIGSLEPPRVRVVVITTVLLFSFVRESGRSWQVEGWREAFASVQARPTGALLVYSGLVELEDPAWAGDPARREYLLAPVGRYLPHPPAPTLPLPAGVERVEHREWLEREVVPVLEGAPEITLISLRKRLGAASGGESVHQILLRYLAGYGFTVGSEETFGLVRVVQLRRTLGAIPLPPP